MKVVPDIYRTAIEIPDNIENDEHKENEQKIHNRDDVNPGNQKTKLTDTTAALKSKKTKTYVTLSIYPCILH